MRRADIGYADLVDRNGVRHQLARDIFGCVVGFIDHIDTGWNDRKLVGDAPRRS